MHAPNYDSLAIMSEIDHMPAKWRALVHEFGFVIVRALRQGGLSADDAEFELLMLRDRKQREWLSTNYVRPRTIAEAFERAIRH